MRRGDTVKVAADCAYFGGEKGFITDKNADDSYEVVLFDHLLEGPITFCDYELVNGKAFEKKEDIMMKFTVGDLVTIKNSGNRGKIMSIACNADPFIYNVLQIDRTAILEFSEDELEHFKKFDSEALTKMYEDAKPKLSSTALNFPILFGTGYYKSKGKIEPKRNVYQILEDGK